VGKRTMIIPMGDYLTWHQIRCIVKWYDLNMNNNKRGKND
jgi:hypothetical protein